MRIKITLKGGKCQKEVKKYLKASRMKINSLKMILITIIKREFKIEHSNHFRGKPL